LHKDFLEDDPVTREIIGAAIEVHKLMGPGLLESIYEECLCREFNLRKIESSDKYLFPLKYKGKTYIRFQD